MCVREGSSCLEMGLDEGGWCPECWDDHFAACDAAAREAFKCTIPCDECEDERCCHEEWPEVTADV